MHIALKRRLLLLLAVISVVAVAAPASAAPAQTAATPCETNCLRVYSIKTYDYLAADAQANVQVVDENVSLARGAVVHGVWTLPDGTTIDRYDVIGTRGRAEFPLYTDQSGTVTFTVVGITLAGYTFDPAGSTVLSASLVIGDPTSDPPPAGCTANCLTVDSLSISARRGDVRARATVVDEDGAAVRGVVVEATWTLPDGTTVAQALTTNRKGKARFDLPVAGSGVYTITIDQVALAGFTFMADDSVTSGSYTVK